MAIIQKSFSDLVDFTRASTATYTDAMGVVRTAGVDEPRFDYDPVTGEPLGVLIEPSRTNSLVDSTDPTLWSKSGVTVEVGSDPDSFLIREDTSTGLHAVSHGGSIQENHTASRGVYLKYAGRQYVAIYNTNATLNSPSGGAVFDVINGTVASTTPGQETTIIDAKIEPAGDGWFFAYVITQDDGDWDTATRSMAISVKLTLTPDYTSAGRSYEGDGASGVLIRYPQYEEGSFPTSYIPTTDSPVTRAADNMSRSLGAEFNPSEGTIFVEYESPLDADATYGRNGGLLFRLSGNGSGGSVLRNQFVAGRFSGVLNFAFRDLDGTGFDYSNGHVGPALPYGQKNKIAISYNSGVGLIAAANGSSATRLQPGLPSVNWTDMSLTTAENGSTFFGHKSVVRYFPRALTEAELIEVTS